jgi:hypothetical protein
MEAQYLLQISEITLSGHYLFVLFGFLCLPFSQKLFGSGHAFLQSKSRPILGTILGHGELRQLLTGQHFGESVEPRTSNQSFSKLNKLIKTKALKILPF